MCEQTGLKRSLALVALAGALAWSPPAFAVEAESETGGTAPDGPVFHTVEPGETLWDIAERYGTSTARLMRENEIEDAKTIWVGTRLRVPVSAARKPSVEAEAPLEAEHSESPEIAALLDRCEAELRAARFEQALASAREARDLIDTREGGGGDPGRVRLEIASATAYVALGQNTAALESLERALVADPNLELDPALTSPKVLAVFRAARGSAPAPR
jgi:LysM repeat protein